MQPLKSLTFVRIGGSANSHKYIVSKKQLRAFKTICNKINASWKECGIKYNVEDWRANKYNYEGDYNDKQEELIDNWKNNNEDLYDKFNKARAYCKFSKTSYHSPPENRGLYAFPQYRLETFLTHWDENKFNIKHCNVGKENESYRKRAKKYITINYNKPTLWCHFIDEAKELKVDIRINKYWVLINSCDYLKVLALWEKKRTKQIRKEMGKNNILVKHCYHYSSKDDLEVFLVGV